MIVMGKDGTAIFFAANQFAAGALYGKYEASGDHLRMFLGSSPNELSTTVNYHYRWTGPDTIAMRLDSAGPKEEMFLRSGDIPKTANIAALAGGKTSAGSVTFETSSCLSNLKQLGLGMQMYAMDYDGTMPDSAFWAKSELPYVKTTDVYTCPTLSRAKKQGGYAMDSRLSRAKTTSINNPQGVVLFFESKYETIGQADPQFSILTSPRHGSGIGFAFADGHAKSILVK